MTRKYEDLHKLMVNQQSTFWTNTKIAKKREHSERIVGLFFSLVNPLLLTSTNLYQFLSISTNSNKKNSILSNFNQYQATSTNLYQLLPIFTNFTHLSTPIYQQKEQALFVDRHMISE